jgi:hypothetical protein
MAQNRDICWAVVDWTDLTQDEDMCWAVVVDSYGSRRGHVLGCFGLD